MRKNQQLVIVLPESPVPADMSSAGFEYKDL